MNEPIKPSSKRPRSLQDAPLFAAAIAAVIVTAALLRFQEYNWAEADSLREMTDRMATMLTAVDIKVCQEKRSMGALPTRQNTRATPSVATP